MQGWQGDVQTSSPILVSLVVVTSVDSLLISCLSLASPAGYLVFHVFVHKYKGLIIIRLIRFDWFCLDFRGAKHNPQIWRRCAY